MNKDLTLQHCDQGISSLSQLFFFENAAMLLRTHAPVLFMKATEAHFFAWKSAHISSTKNFQLKLSEN